MSRKVFLPVFGAVLRLFSRFARARDGVAAVEFALTVPVLLLLYVGSTELSQLITVDSRVATISGTVGDLVARSKNKLAQSDLNTYFVAAQRILQPYSTTDLKQTVTLVKVTPAGQVTVVWSKAYNGAKTYAANANFTLPQQMIDVAKQATANTYVVVSETSYAYMPLLGMVFDTPLTLYHENFYLPRFGGDIQIT